MAAGSPKQQQAVVRCPQSEDQLSISLPLAGRVRNLDRPKNELLGKALGRLRSNALPKTDKKSKKRSSQSAAPAQPDVFVGLYAGPTIESPLLLGSVTNEEAWQHGRLLVVGTQQYILDLNPPIVDKVELPGLPMVGYPICPIPSLLFAEESSTQWQWFRSSSHGTSSTAAAMQGASHEGGGGSAGHHEGFEAIPGAIGRLYVPTLQDENHVVRVQCTPGIRSESQETRLGQPCSADTVPVQCGPTLTAGAHRHPLTPQPLSAPRLRFVTYNILADQYSSQEYSQKVLFGYCPSRFLDPQYRRPLILCELLGFHADIICLQEVDEKAFSEYFLPQLQQAGFEGHYTNKAGSTREGEATFYRTSRFRLAARNHVMLKDCFKDLLQAPPQGASAGHQAAQRAKRHAQFKPMLQSSPHLQQVLQGVSTIAQMTLLEPLSHNSNSAETHTDTSAASNSGDTTATPSAGGSICVVNSHFFFHPNASHVRNIHTAAIMSEVQAFMHNQRSRTSSSNDEPSVATAHTKALGTDTAARDRATDSTGAGASQDGASASRHSNRAVDQEPALVFAGDLNSDFNDGTPGTEPRAHAGVDSRHSDSHQNSSCAQPALLFCGDLNCGLNHGTPGVVQLLNTGQLATDFWDWEFSAGFSWGLDAEEEEGPAAADGAEQPASTRAAAISSSSSSSTDAAPVNGIPLSIPFQLRSADDLQTPFTNYVRGYCGLLDYMWYEPSRLKVERAIPLPTLEEVKGYVPSERFPSDHLSVVFEFSWQPAPAAQQPAPADHSQADAAKQDSSAAPSQAADMTTEPLQSQLPQALPSAQQPQSHVPPDSQLLTPLQMASSYPIAAFASNTDKAVAALQRGQVIATPTDTLYGLAADANSSTGIRQIYSIKHRQRVAPLAICIADVADLHRYCHAEHLPEQLLQQLLPGPVTLILRRKQDAPLCQELNPGLHSIGVRIPDSEFIRAVCRGHGGAIALTSANTSGGTSPLSVNDFMHLWPLCAAVFNGKRIQADRAGSTIIDLSAVSEFKITRPGVSKEKITSLLLENGLRQQV